MRARALAIRRHNYAMRGVAVPRHAISPAPRLTSVQQRRIYWQGSAGAATYSVQRAVRARGPWAPVCSRCVTDLANGYLAARTGWYRLLANNLDGRPSRPSRPVEVS
jgi:mannan endo-1,4-beta-mannosidase